MNTNETFTVEFQGQDLRRFKLRYPKAEFWKARVKAQKVERKQDGGKTRSILGETRMLDFKELQGCVIEAPEDFDEYDAELVVDLLAKCDLTGSDLEEANLYRISATVFGKEEVAVFLRTPSRKQVVQHQKATIAEDYSTRGGSALVITAEPTVKLFNELIHKSQGYQGDVPVPHMDVFLQELLYLCNPKV